MIGHSSIVLLSLLVVHLCCESGFRRSCQHLRLCSLVPVLQWPTEWIGECGRRAPRRRTGLPPGSVPPGEGRFVHHRPRERPSLSRTLSARAGCFVLKLGLLVRVRVLFRAFLGRRRRSWVVAASSTTTPLEPP